MQLTIGWLYHDLMNTYGDRGNILALRYRLNSRNISAEIVKFSVDSSYRDLSKIDLLMMGGAEDRQQQIVANDLTGDKKKAFLDKIAKQTPGLYICGAYQFLGEAYLTADQQLLPCLEAVPISTKNPGHVKPRLTGDLVVTISHPNLLASPLFEIRENRYLIGFENHGGRTFLKDNSLALGTVVHGHGNNGEDRLEGLVFNNSIGTYMHGPILPRNPALCDYLIEKALSIKYNQRVSLRPLDDRLELSNRQYLLKEFHVKN